MTPGAAIGNGVLRSVNFTGRATRAEYWWFLPVGLAIPALAFAALWFLTNLTGPAAFALACLGLVPQAAVTVRRLRDAGQDAGDINPPLGALVIFALSLMAMTALGGWVGHLADTMDGAGGIVVVLAFVPVLLAMIAVTATAFLLGLFTGAALFGQMLLQSAGPARRNSR